ncbi:MAG: hypothetical protein GF308_03060 [Candidatus Heimdallarchaeota archaeon]|nr:hypothetical protein [Candidatus Heimdallarchaeota archaeon]
MKPKIKLNNKVEKAFCLRIKERFEDKTEEEEEEEALSSALEEAVALWLAEHQPKMEKIEKPTEKIQGLLAHLSSTSIELQHEAQKLFLKNEEM